MRDEAMATRVQTQQAQPGQRERAGPWRRPLIVLGATNLALFVLFWPTLRHMTGIWSDNVTFYHCWMVPLVSAWLVYDRIDLFDRLVPRPDWRALPLGLGALLVWLMGWAGDIQLFMHAGLVVMVMATVPLILGFEATRAALFPWLFLLFCIPFGDVFVPPLQRFTADFTVQALQWTGIPVYREGFFLEIPVESGIGRFEVAEACSGIRYQIALLAIGAFYAELSFSAWWRKAMVILLSVAIPVLANGIRAYGIVMIAYWSDLKHGVSVDHLIYGFVFLMIVTGLFLLAASRFADRDIRAPFTLAFTPRNREPRSGLTHARPAAALLGLCGLVVVWTLAAAPGPRSAIALAPLDPAAPAQPVSGQGDWQPVFVNVDAESHDRLAVPDGTVGVYRGYYDGQRPGAELLQYGNLVHPESWTRTASRRREVAVGDRSLTMLAHRVRRGDQPYLVWQLYWTGNQVTVDPLRIKLASVTGKLTGDNAGGVLLLATPLFAGDPDAAVRALSDALEALGPLDALFAPVPAD